MRRMPTLWVSPSRDIHGFFRRYVAACLLIAMLGVAASSIADASGRYYLWSLLKIDDSSPLCNFSIVARFLFLLLVAMEGATLVTILIISFRRHSWNPRKPMITRAHLGAGIELSLLLVFLHFGAYAIALHADDVCESVLVAVRLRHYAALIAFAMLFSLGSIILIDLVLKALKRILGG